MSHSESLRPELAGSPVVQSQNLMHELRQVTHHARRIMAVTSSLLALAAVGSFTQAAQAETGNGQNIEQGVSGPLPPLATLTPTETTVVDNVINANGPDAVKSIRIFVHPADMAGSRQQLALAEQYAEQKLDYKPGSGEPAPIDVSAATNDQDIASISGGKNICAEHLPNSRQANPQFKRRRCIRDMLHSEKNVVELEKENPDIKIWLPQNEPEDFGPTDASVGGPKLAVMLWKIVEQGAFNLGNGQVAAAGELWNYPGKYWKQYLKVMKKVISEYDLPPPTIWAFHPYTDIACAQEKNTKAAITQLEKQGFYISQLLNTEGAVELSTTAQCANALELGNGRHKDTDRLTATDIHNMTMAQIRSARTSQAFSKPIMNIPSQLFLYGVFGTPSPQCWDGGDFDSYFVSAINTYRAAYYEEIHKPVPKYLVWPHGLTQLRLAELTDVPAINWTGSQPNDCKYGQKPVDTVQASPALIRAH